MTYKIRAAQQGYVTSPAPRPNGMAGRALGVRASEGAQLGGEASPRWARNYTVSLGEGRGEAVIGGGCCNFINDSSFTGPAAISYGVIGGGEKNCILHNTNHSSIFSGQFNTVADSCSSILGGAGNTIPAGFPNSFIAGSGIVLNPSVVGNPNSLHVNGLWASNMCTFPIGFPYNTGTVFVVPVGTPPPAGIAGALYIM